MQLVVECTDHMCELQLTTHAMLMTKNSAGHRDFEVARELQAAVAEGDVQRCREALAWRRSHWAPRGASRVHFRVFGARFSLRRTA